jgi:hypothetical protein
MELPFDRFLNLVHFFATNGAEEKDRDQFDVRLHLPPPELRGTAAAVPDSSPWSKAHEEEALGGLVAALSGGGG